MEFHTCHPPAQVSCGVRAQGPRRDGDLVSNWPQRKCSFRVQWRSRYRRSSIAATVCPIFASMVKATALAGSLGIRSQFDEDHSHANGSACEEIANISHHTDGEKLTAYLNIVGHACDEASRRGAIRGGDRRFLKPCKQFLTVVTHAHCSTGAVNTAPAHGDEHCTREGTYAQRCPALPVSYSGLAWRINYSGSAAGGHIATGGERHAGKGCLHDPARRVHPRDRPIDDLRIVRGIPRVVIDVVALMITECSPYPNGESCCRCE